MAVAVDEQAAHRWAVILELRVLVRRPSSNPVWVARAARAMRAADELLSEERKAS